MGMNFIGKCKLCQWYRGEVCHRKPPAVFKIDVMEAHHYYDSIWPYVKEDDYCGEFKNAPEWRIPCI